MSTLRRVTVLAWFAVPLIAISWHYGPGQRALARDQAEAQLSIARSATTRADHAAAAQAFAAALAALPADDPARPPIELEQASATAASGELLQGMDQMRTLLDRLNEHGEGAGALARATRNALGEAHYHAAWLMRLEGASADEWTEEADAARQHFRLLAESANDAQDAEACAKNLETAVRLQRLDLNELKGLPLPKKCPCNCQSLSQRKRKQRESRGEKPQPSESKKNTDDIRKELRQERNAGGGERNGGGS